MTRGGFYETARDCPSPLGPAQGILSFIIEGGHTSITNPCNDPLLSKTFRAPRAKQREIIGKEVVDDIIYRCRKTRDRLILELQAR